jgi:hypothetical protein
MSLRMAAISPKTGSLSSIVRSFKSAVTNWCHANGYTDFGWQPRYHDWIIHDEKRLKTFRRYIRNNPKRWKGFA